MNVILVKHFVEGIDQVFPEVQRELQKLGVRAIIAHDTEPKLKHRLWTLGKPTAVIGVRPIEKFKPSWATIWQQHWLDKEQEYRRLDAKGVPVPRWVSVREGETPDLTGFSEMVLMKPAASCKGAMVRIVKKEKAYWRPLYIEALGKTSGSVIFQEYIHSGPWPTTYRVGTVFGEPFYGWRVEADNSRVPIEYKGKLESEAVTGRSFVSSSKGCRYFDERPKDVLELARAAHAAFWDMPVLGIDMVRDANTGKLYVLEVNASGGAFHINNKSTRGIGIDVPKQFGGARAVARGIFKRLQAERLN
jgi:glutathione synthase/RimK-type ligase-like ATP-grasp enzyme